MKISRLSALLVICAGCILSSAKGALTEWRTQVQVSTGTPGTGLEIERVDGGLNDPASALILTDSGVVSEASSQFDFGGLVPTLRTRVTNTGTRGQAVAWGVQGYTNTGSTALSTTLVMDLSATLTGPNDLEAALLLLETTPYAFSLDPGTMIFETGSLWPGFGELAKGLDPEDFRVDLNDFSGVVDRVRQFDFTVQPGESFYVYAYLEATAEREGVVDAFSTLTASFTDTTGLVPAAVPEPGSVLLAVLGGMLFLGRRRRP
jgi:hypothetical protein